MARDIDQVRSALGEDKITYYGLSYGTVVGPMYATLFPHRVRQMVLDAPVDTNLWFGNSLPFLHDVALASERTLNAWFETCRTEGTAVCPFGAGDPQSAFDTLIDTLEEKPLKIAPAKGATPGGELDGAMALEATRALAGDQNTWPLLTSALLAAQDGNGAPLHTLWSSVTVSPSLSLPRCSKATPRYAAPIGGPRPASRCTRPQPPRSLLRPGGSGPGPLTLP
ncbi:alpha/beta fold hydrolase [Actinomadura luteofluorescens]|uniref:alpha/beta fold hydrolase n=1 Tax=Actinomadura luteofluorescens TaxID=46163 RepID=UPI00362FDA51